MLFCVLEAKNKVSSFFRTLLLSPSAPSPDTRLPDIHEGAGKRIRTFEEETTGKLLALGDIKALLAKCLGASKMNDILKQSSLLQAVDRRDIWLTLRAEYPMQTDPGFLKGEPMEETENPTTYIQKQLRRWKEELERDPEQDKVLTALFRTAIVEAMPLTVKVKLEDVVGLKNNQLLIIAQNWIM